MQNGRAASSQLVWHRRDSRVRRSLFIRWVFARCLRNSRSLFVIDRGNPTRHSVRAFEVAFGLFSLGAPHIFAAHHLQKKAELDDPEFAWLEQTMVGTLFDPGLALPILFLGVPVIFGFACVAYFLASHRLFLVS